jgi:hypothetical protein
MKNVVFSDIKTQIVPHRKHGSFTEPSRLVLCKIWGLTVVLIKNAVFCDVTLCGSCNNRLFGATYCLHHQGDKNRRATNNVSINYQTKHATKKYYAHIPEDSILHISHVRKCPASPIPQSTISENKFHVFRQWWVELTCWRPLFCASFHYIV